MSHGFLIEKGVDPLMDRGLEHQREAQARFSQLTTDHQKRRDNLLKDRQILTGDIWMTDARPGERRIHDSLAHDIVSQAASDTLPQLPSFSTTPNSESSAAQQEADMLVRGIYSLCQATNYRQLLNYAAREQTMGVAPLHLVPDKWAITNTEVPLFFDVPDAGAVLYAMGVRGRIDHCFVKHMMTPAMIKRQFNVNPRQYTAGDQQKLEVWCYYAEERFRDPLSGQVTKKIFYTVMEASHFLYPLTDVTHLLPEIPVFLAFNSDGYLWRGQEEMRALGILTPLQSRLLALSDLTSQLIEGAIRHVRPTIVVSQDPNEERVQLTFVPGGQINKGPNTRLEPFIQGMPPKELWELAGKMREGVAMSGAPHLLQPGQEGSPGSGTLNRDRMYPYAVKNGVRQGNLTTAVEGSIMLALDHLSRVIDPNVGLRMTGTDPRDRSDIDVLWTPESLQNVRVRAYLTEQIPSNAFNFLTLLQGQVKEGQMPVQLLQELTAQWLSLPVRDQSTISKMIDTEREERIQREQEDLLRQQAQQVIPYLQNAMAQQGMGRNDGAYRLAQHNQQQNPNLDSRGRRPMRLGASGQNPRQWEQTEMVGPMQQQAQAARGAP